MGTVRDRTELGAALRSGATEIEVRGALARELARGRLAAGLALLSGMGVLGVAGAMGGLAARHGAGFDARVAVSALVVTLLLSGSLVVALRSGGLAAFRTLRGYREVHRSQGVVVLRRK